MGLTLIYRIKNQPAKLNVCSCVDRQALLAAVRVGGWVMSQLKLCSRVSPALFHNSQIQY